MTEHELIFASLEQLEQRRDAHLIELRETESGLRFIKETMQISREAQANPKLREDLGKLKLIKKLYTNKLEKINKLIESASKDATFTIDVELDEEGRIIID